MGAGEEDTAGLGDCFPAKRWSCELFRSWTDCWWLLGYQQWPPCSNIAAWVWQSHDWQLMTEEKHFNIIAQQRSVIEEGRPCGNMSQSREPTCTCIQRFVDLKGSSVGHSLTCRLIFVYTLKNSVSFESILIDMFWVYWLQKSCRFTTMTLTSWTLWMLQENLYKWLLLLLLCTNLASWLVGRLKCYVIQSTLAK